jgi:multidrug transporter EmrE-like cation transporter
VAAGLLYGVAGLGLKAAATFVQRWGLIGSIPHLVTSPDLYLLAVAMATGLVLFQTGLQRCSASVVSPVNIVTSTSYVIAVGTLLFNEHLPTSAGPLGLRIAGFAGVVFGLVTLAVAGEVG